MNNIDDIIHDEFVINPLFDTDNCIYGEIDKFARMKYFEQFERFKDVLLLAQREKIPFVLTKISKEPPYLCEYSIPPILALVENESIKETSDIQFVMQGLKDLKVIDIRLPKHAFISKNHPNLTQIYSLAEQLQKHNHKGTLFYIDNNNIHFGKILEVHQPKRKSEITFAILQMTNIYKYRITHDYDSASSVITSGITDVEQAKLRMPISRINLNSPNEVLNYEENKSRYPINNGSFVKLNDHFFTTLQAYEKEVSKKINLTKQCRKRVENWLWFYKNFKDKTLKVLSGPQEMIIQHTPYFKISVEDLKSRKYRHDLFVPDYFIVSEESRITLSERYGAEFGSW